MRTLHFGALWTFLLAGCPGTAAPTDDGGLCACASTADCDDGTFCNGREVCTSCACVPGPLPCAAAVCDEASDRCPADCMRPDADEDGFDSVDCGGSDCDDASRERNPGRAEVCDVADVDEDCDPSTFGFRDADMDGEVSDACCNAGEPDATCGTDCNDLSAGVGHARTETCNGIDDDCDGSTDETVTGTTFFRDADGDGHGDPSMSVMLCTPMGEYTVTEAMADDCDDADADVHPLAREICNGRDDDCSTGGGDEPAEDADADGHTAVAYTACESIPSSYQRDDCQDGDPDIHPGAAPRHLGYCGGGLFDLCLRPTGGWGCGNAMPDGWVCDAMISGGTGSWDWDCDGVEEREAPPMDARCDSSCDTGLCGACAVLAGGIGCATPVPRGEWFPVNDPGSLACGTLVLHRRCAGTCASTCATEEAMRPLRCN